MKLTQLQKLLEASNVSDDERKSLLKQAKLQMQIENDKFEDREPKCLKTYFKCIGKLKNLLNTETQLLIELVKNSTNKGDIFLCKALKDKIIKKIGFSEKTYSTKKTLLIKHKYIKRVSYGVYRANPNYFGKGGWHRISEQRKAWLRIDIDERGNEIVSTSMQNLKTDNVYNMEDYF